MSSSARPEGDVPSATILGAVVCCCFTHRTDSDLFLAVCRARGLVAQIILKDEMRIPSLNRFGVGKGDDSDQIQHGMIHGAYSNTRSAIVVL